MIVRTVLLGLAGAALAGCVANKKLEETTGTVPRCRQHTSIDSTCRHVGGTLTCPVLVHRGPDGPVVKPYTLQVPPGRPAIIEWHLAGPDDEFSTGDRPEFGNNDEFGNGTPVDGNGVAGPRGKKYRMEYKNTKPNRSHAYVMAFSTPGGPVRCDPTIVNQSD